MSTAKKKWWFNYLAAKLHKKGFDNAIYFFVYFGSIISICYYSILL